MPTARFAGKRYDSYAAFDTAFKEFEQKLSSVETIRLADVPFPPVGDPAGLKAAGLPVRGGSERNDEERAKRRKMLHKGLLRWHPDKWAAVIGKVKKEEHGVLGECLSALTQEIVEMKD